MSKKKNLPLLENLVVTDIAAEGKAIIKTDDRVIFTQYAVPGDVVDLQITRKKNRYLEGRVVAFADREDIDLPIEENLIVEYYSK